MMQTPPSGSWLRTLYGLFAAVAVMTLAACGGGSGAPNNPYAPVAALLTVTPVDADRVLGSGDHTHGDRRNAPVFGILLELRRLAGRPVDDRRPLTLVPGGVDSDTTVPITIQDIGGQSAVANVASRRSSRSRSPSCPPRRSRTRGSRRRSPSRAVCRRTARSQRIPPSCRSRRPCPDDGRAARGQRQRRYRVDAHDPGLPPDSATTAAVTVRAAPLLNSLTITPSGSDCGASAICSGQNGTAVVTVLGPGGGALAGRQVKFDVIAGPYGITRAERRAARRHHADGHLRRDSARRACSSRPTSTRRPSTRSFGPPTSRRASSLSETS